MKTTYYKLIDPINGNVTKTYGFERELRTASVKVTFDEDNTPTVHKYDVHSKKAGHVPRGEGVQQISKEEFDALDTSQESVYSQYSRERKWLKILRELNRVPKEIPNNVEAFEASLKRRD